MKRAQRDSREHNRGSKALFPAAASIAALALGLAGCGGDVAAKAPDSTAATSSATASAASSPSPSPSEHGAHSGDGPVVVVRDKVVTNKDGSRAVTMGLPGGSYTPSAPQGGTDDYRCFLLNPKLKADTFMTGFGFHAGNPKVVHHAILFKVEPDSVAAVQSTDAKTPEPGWSCFGDSGIPQPEGQRVQALNNANWMGAWAPGGKPNTYGKGTGVALKAGTQVVLQVHYNLLAGDAPDSSGLTLAVAKPGTKLKELHTMLLPAPVDLPCTPDQAGPLCDRTAAMADLVQRVGDHAAPRVGGLALLCGIDPARPVIGPTQTCDRPVREPMTLIAAAGHMHLLGKSISVDKVAANGTVSNLLSIPVWDFDDQGSRRLSKPVSLAQGDKLRVTCTHDASLRDRIPSLSELPDRHVLWGEGTSDEMCLGILTYLTP